MQTFVFKKAPTVTPVDNRDVLEVTTDKIRFAL